MSDSAMGRAAVLLGGAVARQEIPGAVACWGRGAENQLVGAWGVTRLGGAAVLPDTRYDLASLSKVVGTLPSVLALVEGRALTLDDPVGRFFSQAGWFQTPSLGEVTLRQLLTHTSGLPAWRPLFGEVSTRLSALGCVLQTPLAQGSGESAREIVYSDLGFILLGAVVERVSGQRLDAFAQEHVFGPLEMTATGYGASAGVSVAATEDCGWRGRLLEGEVHDENAFVFEGVAGHAGLFGTADDLARYAQAWLTRSAPFASEALLAEAVREQATGAGGLRRGLGWQLAGEGSSAGHVASPAAYGHTGFTGTSLWLDPEKDHFGVLLTNRVHPSRTCGSGIHALRVGFYDALFGG
jgi:CubicO group peptidase (beta-lactamase class C family)